MVGQALRHHHHVVGVISERRRPGQDRNVGQRGKLGLCLSNPGTGVQIVDRRGLRALREQRAAQREVAVDHHDAGAGAGGGERRGQAGRAGANHQHVAMGVDMVVDVRVGMPRRPPKTGGGADQPLNPPPHTAPPHERLVVEPGRQQRREDLGRPADIEIHPWPDVLRPGVEAVIQLDLGGPRVRFGVRPARRDLHQGARLVLAGGEDAARTVVLDAAADEVNAVGQQRRRQRIADEAGMAVAGEAERHRPGPVDAAAGGEAKRLVGHRDIASSGGRAASGQSTDGGASPMR